MDCVYIIRKKYEGDRATDYSGDSYHFSEDRGILRTFKTEEECIAYLEYEGYYLSRGHGWMKKLPYSEYYSCEIEKLLIDTFEDCKVKGDKRKELEEQKAKLQKDIDSIK